MKHYYYFFLITFTPSCFASMALDEQSPQNISYVYDKEPRQHGSLCLPKTCYDDTSDVSQNYPITTRFNRRMCSVLECCITGQDDPALDKGYSGSLDEEDRKIETRLVCLSCSIAATVTTVALYFVGCCISTTVESCMVCVKKREEKIIHYSPLPDNSEFEEEHS